MTYATAHTIRGRSIGLRSAFEQHDRSLEPASCSITDYDYDAGDSGLLVVGAYSFFDTIPAEARLYTCNLAYSWPVQWGPISQLMFYNDYNIMTDKSGGLNENTILNVSGVAVTAGGLYTYFDLLSATNQPFVGSSMAADDEDWNTRLNINVGFSFASPADSQPARTKFCELCFRGDAVPAKVQVRWEAVFVYLNPRTSKR